MVIGLVQVVQVGQAFSPTCWAREFANFFGGPHTWCVRDFFFLPIILKCLDHLDHLDQVNKIKAFFGPG
jgi:hypothetical protein